MGDGGEWGVGGGGAGEVSVGRKTAESDRKCVILRRKINIINIIDQTTLLTLLINALVSCKRRSITGSADK